jgi:Tfp pilus assembly protein FimT
MTLIELLIVISIIGLVTSLIAPSSLKVVDQAKSSEELMALTRVAGALRFEAYSKGSPIRVSAQGNTLRWSSQQSGQRELVFEHLSFSKEYQLIVDANGNASMQQLEVIQRGRPRIVAIGGDSL